MWALTTEEVIIHLIREDKSTATMLDILGDNERVVTCDMLSTHLSAVNSTRSNGGLQTMQSGLRFELHSQLIFSRR